MSPLSADQYAAAVAADLDLWDALRPRSRQAALGVSDIGSCYSLAKYKLQGITPTDAPSGRQALHGTALHEMWVAARSANNRLMHEVELSITLPSGLVVLAHADEVDPDEPSVTDLKTVADDAELRAVRRQGSSEQQRFQRHLYYLGAHQAGLVPPVGVVRNVWVDRAGQSQWPHVEQELFDMAQVHAADAWIQQVQYAVEHDEEVPRDRHADWCKSFCAFFTHCRGSMTHVDEVVDDPELQEAAALLYTAREEGREMEALEKHARRLLEPLQTSAGDVAVYELGEYRLRWARINKGDGQWRAHISRVEA